MCLIEDDDQKPNEFIWCLNDEDENQEALDMSQSDETDLVNSAIVKVTRPGGSLDQVVRLSKVRTPKASESFDTL